MHVREAIEKRRSVKRFDPGHRMPQEDIDTLLRLARLSPTAFNLQHCRHLVVTDPALRRALRAVSFDQSQVTDASLLVVICGDVMAWAKDPERCWDHAPAAVRENLGRTIRAFYASDPQLQRDECVRSCSIAAMTLMLAAQDLGYDSCPMDGFDVAAVARLINLPDDHLVNMFVAIGKALEPALPRGSQLSASQAIIENRFR